MMLLFLDFGGDVGSESLKLGLTAFQATACEVVGDIFTSVTPLLGGEQKTCGSACKSASRYS